MAQRRIIDLSKIREGSRVEAINEGLKRQNEASNFTVVQAKEKLN